MTTAVEEAAAQSFSPTLTQYAHTSWRIRDGNIGGAVNGITQTRDGYLWVATDAGLERFDGIQFQSWAGVTATAVSVLAARDGSLWVGTTDGVFHMRNRQLEHLARINGRVNALLEDSDGTIWLGRSRTYQGGLCSIRGRTVRCYSKQDGILCDRSGALAEGAGKKIWVGGDQGICEWNGHAAGALLAPGRSFENLNGVNALAPMRDGSMLAGYSTPGQQFGLQQISNGKSTPFRAQGLDGSQLSVTALLVDHAGGLWIGTRSAGLVHVVNGVADRFSRSDGLSGDSIHSLYQDREGDVWAGTSDGIDEFHRLAVVSYSAREGLTADYVTAVLAARDGTVWASNEGALDVLKSGRITHLDSKDGLPGHQITSLLEDRNGLLWMGVDNDLAYFKDGAFHIVRKPDGTRLSVIRSMAVDGGNTVWAVAIGHPQRLYRIRNGLYLDEFKLPFHREPHGVSSDSTGGIWIGLFGGGVASFRDGALHIIPGALLQRMVAAKDGSLLGESRDGLYRLHNNSWSLLTAKDGLPCANVGAIAFDQRNALWIRTQCGIAIVDARALARFWADPRQKPPIRVLDVSDGARAAFGSFSPVAATSPDGRLWFATDSALLSVDPAHMPRNDLPPPVHIERIVADHTMYEVNRSLSLPPLTRDLEIDYSGLSFVAPDKMQFRYRLWGYEKEWHDVGNRRSAFYMNLSPGAYRFDVIAANNDGVWNLAGASIPVTIRPAFYQMRVFQMGVFLFAIALLWWLVTWRMRYLTSQAEARLSERQAERVRIARELHDTLLQGFQGLLPRFQVVANRLPEGDGTREMMESVLESADDLLIESRDRVRDLRSAEEAGSPLAEELRRLAYNLERDGCPPIEIKSSGTPIPLKPDVQREVLAIAKEALTNACRHAQAKMMACVLQFETNAFTIVCRDDGRGIEPVVLRAGAKKDHWGLPGMAERAKRIGGSFTIDSTAAEGTRIVLRLKARTAYLRPASGFADGCKRLLRSLWPNRGFDA